MNNQKLPEDCLSDADCWQEAATLAATENSWTDPDGTKGMVRWYRVQAVDHAGNRSLYGGPVQAILHDVTGPQPPGIKVDECWDSKKGFPGFCINGGGDDDTKRFRIACRMTPDTDEVLLDIVEGNQLLSWDFHDVFTPPFPLEDVTCRVWAEDSHGNLSEPSPEVVVPLIVAPETPTLLPPVITSIETAGSAETGWQSVLTWDMVNSPAIAGFDILRKMFSTR
ncbi:hypothetical protein KFU94_10980 [Chloroflexi bacterium TSY]|nr:hypothetical protein [Chloroflexi bacterium TSY]